MKKIFTILAIVFIGTISSFAKNMTVQTGNFQYSAPSGKIKIQKPAPGCCSGHGGIASCGAFNYYKCKDGTLSKTCKCKKIN